MTLSPRSRTAWLTAHVVTSVGFLGAVVVFFMLALVGLLGTEPDLLRGVYLAADLATRLVIVWLCLTSTATGLVLSLGTPWGLVRHWWMVAKLAIAAVSTGALFLHVRLVTAMMEAATGQPLAGGDLVTQRLQLVVASGAAILALLVATILSVAKPRGLTRHGWRQRHRGLGARAT